MSRRDKLVLVVAVVVAFVVIEVLLIMAGGQLAPKGGILSAVGR